MSSSRLISIGVMDGVCRGRVALPVSGASLANCAHRNSTSFSRRGRTCAKGVVTPNQLEDPDRILYPLKREGERGGGRWQQVSWDEALNDIAARLRSAIVENRRHEIMYHVGRPGEDGYANRVLQSWGVDGHNSHTNVKIGRAHV